MSAACTRTRGSSAAALREPLIPRKCREDESEDDDSIVVRSSVEEDASLGSSGSDETSEGEEDTLGSSSEVRARHGMGRTGEALCLPALTAHSPQHKPTRLPPFDPVDHLSILLSF